MSTVRLREVAQVIRSKNAGPYELTLDVMFPTEQLYARIRDAGVFSARAMAALYRVPEASILKVVHYDPARAVKVTMVRPLVSGAVGETDVYGAQQHAPLLDLEIPAALVAGEGRGR
ncbi:MAG: DUF4387 domain-containing protein [Deltaproteobacteria bacterium]|nr:DUF4387 domain-containing protein [Deltaproteobacteria bacterium]